MAYKFQTVAVPGATDGTRLGGINNDGVVSGSDAGFGSDHYNHSFTYANGQISPFNIAGKPNTKANGINSAGQVAGIHGTDPTGELGFVWSPDGSVQNVPDNAPTVSGVFDQAYDINDNGQVVGANFTTRGHLPEAFLWQDGNMSIFMVPGAKTAEAHGINNDGVIVGNADNSGFKDVNGTFTKFVVPGAVITDPMSINSNGKIVGSYADAAAHWHGFIDTNGTMSFINAPGAADTWITGVNDNGTIVGYFDTKPGGPAQGFIARDPVRTMVREDYVGLLGHDADPATQAFWTNLIKTGGLTPHDFVGALMQSDESRAQHGGQTAKQFVNSIYENALGRPAEPETQTAWANVIHSGTGRGAVMNDIATSQEGKMHFVLTHG